MTNIEAGRRDLILGPMLAGQYFVLIRWHPGYMSAPHWYETDRL